MMYVEREVAVALTLSVRLLERQCVLGECRNEGLVFRIPYQGLYSVLQERINVRRALRIRMRIH